MTTYILVDGNENYARARLEALEEMFNGTDVTVELVTETVESMSGAKSSKYYLKITKKGG